MRILLLLLLPFAAHAASTVIAGQPDSGDPQPFTVTGGQITTTLGECEDATLAHCRVSLGGDSVLISSATSTEVKEGAGELIGFYVSSTSSGTITFYDDNDGTCNSSAKTGTITPAVGWHFLPLRFSTAICALTASTINVTVVYR